MGVLHCRLAASDVSFPFPWGDELLELLVSEFPTAAHALTTMHSRGLINSGPAFQKTTSKPDKIITSSDPLLPTDGTKKNLPLKLIYVLKPPPCPYSGRSWWICLAGITEILMCSLSSLHKRSLNFHCSRATTNSANWLHLFCHLSFHIYWSPEITLSDKATSGPSDATCKSANQPCTSSSWLESVYSISHCSLCPPWISFFPQSLGLCSLLNFLQSSWYSSLGLFSAQSLKGQFSACFTLGPLPSSLSLHTFTLDDLILSHDSPLLLVPWVLMTLSSAISTSDSSNQLPSGSVCLHWYFKLTHPVQGWAHHSQSASCCASSCIPVLCERHALT